MDNKPVVWSAHMAWSARVVWTDRDIKAMLKGLDTHGRGDKKGVPVYDSCSGQ